MIVTCVSTKLLLAKREARTLLCVGKTNLPLSLSILSPASLAGVWRPKLKVIPLVWKEITPSSGSRTSSTASLTVLTRCMHRLTTCTVYRKKNSEDIVYIIIHNFSVVFYVLRCICLVHVYSKVHSETCFGTVWCCYHPGNSKNERAWSKRFLKIDSILHFLIFRNFSKRNPWYWKRWRQAFHSG